MILLVFTSRFLLVTMLVQLLDCKAEVGVALDGDQIILIEHDPFQECTDLHRLFGLENRFGRAFLPVRSL